MPWQIEAAIGRSRPDPSSVRHANPSLSLENAGGSRRKPTLARRCTVARIELPGMLDNLDSQDGTVFVK